MTAKLKGLKVAILVTNGFEQVEMTEPKKALEDAGAAAYLVAPEKTVQGMNHDKPGDRFETEILLDKAQPEDFDALVLPGGVANPDRLRCLPKAVQFVREFYQADKPIAAICHGSWTLINAEAVKGKTMTSWPSLQVDLVNAGAKWVDKEVVRDGKLVTSRKPDDIPAFNKEMIAVFASSKI